MEYQTLLNSRLWTHQLIEYQTLLNGRLWTHQLIEYQTLLNGRLWTHQLMEYQTLLNGSLWTHQSISLECICTKVLFGTFLEREKYSLIISVAGEFLKLQVILYCLDRVFRTWKAAHPTKAMWLVIWQRIEKRMTVFVLFEDGPHV